MREKLVIGLSLGAALLLAYNLYEIFLVLPDEAMQGAIYRIIFFHVPAAITGMVGYFVALVFSVLYLTSGNFRYDSLAASVVEVSIVFSLVNIVTGSIWARIIWGIWWTWDYR
ncbi:MAG: cytochrome c biogenesis protein CcsA, partial [Acidobacteriaceae bacterium]|nr:cytochrome c biogenesis protein CcsA [Acidobacteriaceae bacterium]